VAWNAKPSPGGPIGLAAALVVLTLDGALLLLLLRRPITLFSFVLALLIVLSLPLLALLGYWLYGFFRLRYLLDRNGLTIVWAATRRIIPLPRISRVVRGETVEGETVIQGVSWPGCHVGYGDLPGIGETFFCATRPLLDQLLLVTPSRAYAISPADLDGFLADLELRRRLGPLKSLAEETHKAPWMTLPIWADRGTHLLLALGAVVNAGLFAYVCWRYPALPSLLPLHFDALGQPDRIGLRAEVFKLPAIGLVILAANSALALLLHGRERLAATLLFAAALFAQFLLGVALLNIVH
jgi:hypothetical protein